METETLQPGENITIAYNLSGLEKGDWTKLMSLSGKSRNYRGHEDG